MSYTVPSDFPKSCVKCPFSCLQYSHPFWTKEKPNMKGYICQLDQDHRLLEIPFDDIETKAEWCPLQRTDKEKLFPCEMCYNARLDDELTDDNDGSYISVGQVGKGFRIMIGSGGGKPVRLLFEMWNEKAEIWEPVGQYYPNYCPNCGRHLIEYEEISK